MIFVPVAPIRAVCDEFYTALTLKCPVTLLTEQTKYIFLVCNKIIKNFEIHDVDFFYFALIFLDDISQFSYTPPLPQQQQQQHQKQIPPA